MVIVGPLMKRDLITVEAGTSVSVAAKLVRDLLRPVSVDDL